MVATSMGRNKKAVANFLGQTDTGATECYMHAADPDLWEIAQRLEAEIGDLPAEAEQHAHTGVKSGVSGVKDGVDFGVEACSQVSPDVSKRDYWRTERWPSGRRRTPAKRVWG